jgi:hypothetical protein
LLAKTAFLRPQYWRYYDKPTFYTPLLEKSKKIIRWMTWTIYFF